MKKWNLGIIGLLVVLFTSCETDVDLIQEYEADAFVFGLLDQHEDTQYVRVNRAFLGTSSINDMVLISDSINYNPDDLTVEINSIKLEELLVSKNTGFFNNDDYIIYFTTDPIFYSENNQAVDYSLKVTNNRNGKVVQTNTPIQLVQDVTLTRPRTGTGVTSLVSTSPQGNIFTDFYDIEWQSTENAVKHEVYVTFFYEEIILSTNDTTTYSFDYPISTVENSKATRGSLLKTSFSPSNFYARIGQELEVKSGIQRIRPRLAIYMIIGNQDFSLYVDASLPTNDINQNRPDYSNLSNGLGIFGARNNRYVTPQLDFNQNSLEMLISSPETRDLSFKQI